MTKSPKPRPRSRLLDLLPPFTPVVNEPVITDPAERMRVARKALSGGPRGCVAVDPVKAVGRK